MSTEETNEDKPRRGRQATVKESLTVEIPPHPPLHPVEGIRTDEMREWFKTYYPALAAFVYHGRILTQPQP